MRSYFLSIFLLLFVSIVNGQNSAQINHTKYWYLKNRLNHFFLVIGDDYNQSIPATIRNRIDHSSIGDSGGGYANNVLSPDSIRGFSLDYTDAPQQIGLYIATLATEYKLLKLNNQNTSKVKKELYYALYAINRLDDCESEYPWLSSTAPINHFFSKERKYNVHSQTSSNLDGRLLRGEYYRGNPNDLVNHPGFVDKYYDKLNEGVEYYFNSPNNIGNPKGNPKKVNLSMLIEGGTLNLDFNDQNFFNLSNQEDLYYSGDKVEKLKSGAMMSQDHLAKILFGLAFVVKYVEQNEVHQNLTFQDGETSLKVEAAKITDRICKRLALDGYLVKRPDGATLPEQWGGNAKGFSYGFASAGKWIVEQIGMSNWSNNYFNEVTSNWEFIGWRNFLVPTVLTNESLINNLWIYLTLACVNDKFGSQITTNNSEMYLYSQSQDWQPFYTLAHSLLHNKSCLTNQSKIEEHLNQMPCEGPYNFNDQFSGGWCTPRRYHNKYNQCEDHKGNFNGLEWMLLYNMYVLHEKLENTNSVWAQTNFIDLMDRDINLDLPFGSSGVQIGTTQTPLELTAFNSINYIGTVNNNSYITLHAGYNININNYAEINPYTNIYVQPIVCANGLIPTLRKNENRDEYLFGSKDIMIPNRMYFEEDLNQVGVKYTESTKNELVKLKNANETIKVYPNPFKDYLNISSNNNIVYVVNNSGAEVFRSKGVHEIDTQDWQEGCFIICVINDKGETANFKLIKNY